MFKKIIYIICCTAVFLSFNSDKIKNYIGNDLPQISDLLGDYSWAKESADALLSLGAISVDEEMRFFPQSLITKEQFAKMLSVTLLPQAYGVTSLTYTDINKEHWAYPYILKTAHLFPISNDSSGDKFGLGHALLKEEAAFCIYHALGKTDLPTSDAFDYSDIDKIDESLKDSFFSMVEAKIINGSDGFLEPKKALTRAEAVVILKRALDYKNNKGESKLKTEILGEETISLEKAIRWAKSKNADECFINVAKYYWEYGEKTGIRPEILYAQAAKETNYGKYTGNVKKTQNNWAGIKTAFASGDNDFDHESFSSAEDGVRAHFNHMSAYVGLSPVGDVHERYNKTVTASWAGTIKYVEELGGKWAPDASYGKSIVADYLKPMYDA